MTVVLDTRTCPSRVAKKRAGGPTYRPTPPGDLDVTGIAAPGRACSGRPLQRRSLHRGMDLVEEAVPAGNLNIGGDCA
jgi:hypothetical protein